MKGVKVAVLTQGGTVLLVGHRGRRVSQRSEIQQEQKSRSTSVAGISTGLLLTEKDWGTESGSVRAPMGMNVWHVHRTT